LELFNLSFKIQIKLELLRIKLEKFVSVTENHFGHKKGFQEILESLMVPEAGIEPARYCYHWILSPARLPVPPLRHA
jgi:hypothetical protein